MRINHNISALNAWRQLSLTDTSLTKSLERLSSGLRINRAADDAAGLAISEKMRGQIRGLNQAIRNAQDGISLIQTAEGALQETHAILQRMRELADQAANDTNTTADRLEIQKEVDQLAKELSRITNTTEFNTKNLLAGAFSGQAFAIGANPNQIIEVGINAMDAASLGVVAQRNVYVVDGGVVSAASFTTGSTITTGTYLVSGTWEGTSGFTASGSDTLTVRSSAFTAFTVSLVNGQTPSALSVTWNDTDKTLTVELADNGTSVTSSWQDVLNAINAFSDNNYPTLDFEASLDGVATNTAGTATIAANSSRVDFQLAEFSTSSTQAIATVSATFSAGATQTTVTLGGLSLQYDLSKLSLGNLPLDGAVAESVVDVVARDSSAAVIGANGQVVNEATVEKGLLVNTREGANQAISSLDRAIALVSAERSKLGAIQNRLDHTVNNLGVASENLTAAESRIRDVDMAQEMMEFTRNQILIQAGTAMLAQANVKPQSVLQLLA